MNFNDIDWIGLSLGFAGQTVFLTVALWIMLKLQSLERNILGVIGCAALACALDHIPYIGWELSFVVLLLCVTKLIHARTFTDAIFTVGIAYAITFAFNMFVLTMLVGDLRHSTKVRARNMEPAPAAHDVVETNELSGNNSPTTPKPSVATPVKAEAAVPTPQSSPAAPLAPVPAPPGASGSAPVATPVPSVDTNRLNSARMAGDIMKHFFVKGFSQGATMSIAMISNGTKNFDVSAGDFFQLETSDGRYAAVKCESVAEGQVVISVDGVQVTLLRR